MRRLGGEELSPSTAAILEVSRQWKGDWKSRSSQSNDLFLVEMETEGGQKVSNLEVCDSRPSF